MLPNNQKAPPELNERWKFLQIFGLVRRNPFGAPLGGAMFALEILHHEHIVEYYDSICFANQL